MSGERDRKRTEAAASNAGSYIPSAELTPKSSIDEQRARHATNELLRRNAPTTYRPTTCTHCGNGYYAPTEWVQGQRVIAVQLCAGCGGDGALGGGDE